MKKKNSFLVNLGRQDLRSQTEAKRSQQNQRSGESVEAVIDSVVGDVNEGVCQTSEEPGPGKVNRSGTAIPDQVKTDGEKVENDGSFEDVFNMLGKLSEELARFALRGFSFFFLLDLVTFVIAHRNLLAQDRGGATQTERKDEEATCQTPTCGGQKKSVTRFENGSGGEHFGFFFFKKIFCFFLEDTLFVFLFRFL